MFRDLGARRVLTPDGVEWWVGRRWVTGRPRRGWKPRLRAGADGRLPSVPIDIPGGDADWVALGAVAVVLLVFVVAPLLLFGLELVILGCFIAAGIIGRVMLRQPWIVEARIVSGQTRLLEWQVVGWRRSGRLIDEVAANLTAGREPDPDARWRELEAPVARV